MHPYPDWLRLLAIASLALSGFCFLAVLLSVVMRPQKMWIMNLVWPISALYSGPIALIAYWIVGSRTTRQRHRERQREMSKECLERQKQRMKSEPPTRTQVAVGVSHCGAGCTLGDIVGEWWLFAMPLAFLGGEFPTKIAIDFALAWSFGVAFQYFTIAPMRGISGFKGIAAAMKADTVSIIAFQIGMTVWMALTYYVFFPGPHLHANEAVFWFMMQIAMVVGFFTSYPANVWLLKKGWKEPMPEAPEAAHPFTAAKAA